MSSLQIPLITATSCRCCGAIKNCRLFDAEYEWMGQKEVYCEMLLECFELELLHIDDDDKACICAKCVSRLRNAYAFKEQILNCEKEYLEKWHEINQDLEDAKENDESELQGDLNYEEADELVQKSSVTETLEENFEKNSEEIFNVDDSTYQEDDECQVDCESLEPEFLEDELEEDILDNNNAGGIIFVIHQEQLELEGTLSIDDTYEQVDSETDNKTDSIMTETDKAVSKFMHRNNIKNKISQRKGILNKSNSKKALKRQAKSIKGAHIYKRYKKRNKEKRLSVQNVITLVECSYICPFQCRRNNFYCFYCKSVFTRPEDLREHTLSHDPGEFKTLPQHKIMIKIDIQRIDCRLCSEKIYDLDQFKEHITSVHNRVFHNAPGNFIPFCASFHNPTCLVCDKSFFDFVGLYTITHYSNYTCEICGKCFVEDTVLYYHMKHYHSTEKHICEYCGKRFKQKYTKRFHIATIHKKTPPVECPKCDERFMTYNQKNKHLVEAHGDKWPNFPCKLCDRSYRSPKVLAEHLRRFHFRVRKHQCQFCDKRFYVPCKLKDHIKAIHIGERDFQCGHCNKACTSLNSLRLHMKSHSVDKLMCEGCGQTFKQYASLKAHIKQFHSFVPIRLY